MVDVSLERFDLSISMTNVYVGSLASFEDSCLVFFLFVWDLLL